MFRGKESSNRIELSQLVQDLLNFSVLDSLQLWGGGRWVEGVWGHLGAWRVSPHACTCMHMHAHTCIHVYKLQMAADMEASMFIMFSMFNMHVHACMCACMCVHMCMVHPQQPYTHSHPHPPICHPLQGESLESVKIR